MVGVTFVSVEKRNDDELEFVAEDGRTFLFYHSQQCCEQVYIEDICGDLDDLIGVPLVEAMETSNDTGSGSPSVVDERESVTWTFYRFTGKGTVTIRWYGTSNGYYSESVSLIVKDRFGNVLSEQ